MRTGLTTLTPMGTEDLPQPDLLATQAPALPAASLLQLIWLASPALPVGGFSYSEVLESSVEHGYIATENEASAWLSDQLHLTLARADLPVLAQAVRAWLADDTQVLADLNDWMLQTRESAELRLQTTQMGRSLMEWLRNHRNISPERLQCCAMLTEPTYPVVFALAASATQASEAEILLAYAFGWAENMMQAAIKAVPLGQSAGQRILAQLAQDIPAVVQSASTLPLEQRQSFSPVLAILSARHETQYSRLFRS